MPSSKARLHFPTLLQVLLLLIAVPLVILAGITIYSYVQSVIDKASTVTYTAPRPLAALRQQFLDPDTATYLFFGDIMLGRNVENIMNEKGDDVPFTHVPEMIQTIRTTLGTKKMESTYVIGNLEGPILIDHVHTPSLGFQFSFPTRVTEVLKSAGFTHLSLANNHSRDWGPQGELETAQHLRDSGIVPMVHASSTLVGKVQIITADDVLRTVSTTQLCELISPDTYSILFIHWGGEYGRTPNTRQRQIAQTLHDCGIDMIIGHHPHVTQTILAMRGGSFFSLGNFIFDQYFSEDVQRGLVVGLRLTKTEAKFVTFPIVIERSVPRLMREDEYDETQRCERTQCEFVLSR